MGRRNNTGDVAVPAHAGGPARSRRNNSGDVAVPAHAGVSPTPLEAEWQRASPGLDDPGTRLMRTLARRDGSAAAQSRSRSPHSKALDEEALLPTVESQGLVSHEPERSFVSHDDAKEDVKKAIGEFDEF